MLGERKKDKKETAWLFRNMAKQTFKVPYYIFSEVLIKEVG